jgi:SAM-dependent methyltransferase
MTALTDWADQLSAWQIPPHILAGVDESPWVLPRSVFIRRADRQIADPVGGTHVEAMVALAEPGTVLDVGCAAGATSLSLARRAPVTTIVGLDTDVELLHAFADRGARVGVPVRCVRGQWPDAAGEAGAADVVIAGNVLYNVPDLAPFVRALNDAARRTVIVEQAERHPLTALNELWRHFHGVVRPAGPNVDDTLAALAELDIHPRVRRWKRPRTAEYDSYDDMLDVTRRRLCLPVSALAEIDRVLRESGVDPEVAPDLGSSGENMATLVWDVSTLRR